MNFLKISFLILSTPMISKYIFSLKSYLKYFLNKKLLKAPNNYTKNMLKNKSFTIVILIILMSSLLTGCIEDQQVTIIKYKSTEVVTLKEKQGLMTFNITIRINDTAKNVRLWQPYPISNDNQMITNVTINGNYNYSGIFSESKYNLMILYAEWENPKSYPNLIPSCLNKYDNWEANTVDIVVYENPLCFL